MNSRLLEVAKDSARKATQVLLEHLGTAAIDFKADQTQNLVTAADLAAEEIILKTIKNAFPDHQVLGEEGLSKADMDAEHLVGCRSARRYHETMLIRFLSSAPRSRMCDLVS